MSEIDTKPQDGLTEEERIAKAKEEAVKEVEAKAEADKAAMILDLQTERKKRQDAEKALEEKGEQTPTEPGADPRKVLEQLLEEKASKEAETNKSEALEEFKRTVREFSPENDAAGIVFSAFEKELGKFNLNGLKTKEDFKRMFTEVNEFMNRKKSPTSEPENFYNGTRKSAGSAPSAGDSANLSDVEKKLINDMGWDNERYLKQKAKRPEYIASLLTLRS